MSPVRGMRHHPATVAAILAAAIVVTGCATWAAPDDAGDAALRARALTASRQGVQVSAAVLGAADSLRMFGTDLTAGGVQPVWVEVRNGTGRALWLLRSGTDPDYFSPREVAWSAHVRFADETNQRIDEHFDALAFPNRIPARTTTSGVLFTNPQPVTKILNVDLLGSRKLVPFTLFLPVPGDPGQAHAAIHQYADSEITQYDDLESLRHALERLPCCASTKEGDASGEPLNVVLIGSLYDVAAALARRGYRRDSTASDGTQFQFGRPPDVVIRKRAQPGAPAHWLRIWRAPINFRGQGVLVAQAGRPVGGRFNLDGAAGVRLHGAVDEARNAVIHDFMYSGGLERIGFVTGVGAVPADQPRLLSSGVRYHTDGGRVALFFATRPLTFSDVNVLDWESVVQATGTGASKELDDTRE